LGFGGDEEPAINYSERAPLVIPPKRDMRQPANSPALDDPSWPKDPDAKKRAKLSTEDRPRGPANGNAQLLSADELAAGTLDGPSRDKRTPAQMNNDFDHQSRPLNPRELNRKTALGGSTTPLSPGVEPPRRSLIEPPKGLRMPSAAAPLKGDEPLPSEADENAAKTWYQKFFGG